MESLSTITSFVRVAETLSFAEAARSLGISPSAVGKNVAGLEQRLGVRLFQRTTRRVTLTDEGAMLHDRYRRILDDLRDAEVIVADAGAAPRGTLRISLPTIGYRFLVPVLPEFARRNPGIVLDLHFNDRLVDLLEEDMDAAIRSGDLGDSSLMARRIGQFAFVLCASPSYVAHRGSPTRPADLADHDAIRFRFPTTGQLQSWPMIESQAAPATSLVCSNMEAVRAAAIQAMGIAYMPDFLARDAVGSGDLVTLLDEHRPPRGQFSIVWPSNRHMSSRLRAFIDFVCEHALFQRDLATRSTT